MNLYVDVPKDITQIKTKVAFNLTKRQLICFGIGIVCGIGVYFGTRLLIGTTLAMLLLVLIALPFFFVATYEKLGQPFEVILKNYIQFQFLQPKVRIMGSDNIYRDLESYMIYERQVNQIVQHARKREKKAKE